MDRAADELAQTEAERAALDALREASGGDAAMERHCVRLFRIAQRMADERSEEVDREVLVCAAFLHDAGLYPPVASRDAYVTDGRRLAERVLAPFDWPPERLSRCLDAIEQHHAPGSRWDWGTEVELTRRADQVDVTRGLVRFGVPRAWLRDLFAQVPRDGLYRMLAREVGRMVRERPRSLAGVANPPGRGRA